MARKDVGMNVVSVERGCAQFAGRFLNYQPQEVPVVNQNVTVFNKSMYLIAILKVVSEVTKLGDELRFKAKLFYLTPEARQLANQDQLPRDWFRQAGEVLVVVPTNNKLEVDFYPVHMAERI